MVTEIGAPIQRAFNVGLLAFVSPPLNLIITTGMGVFFALPNQRMSQLAAAG